MLNNYGLQVKIRLLELGISQNELCEMLGISKSNLSSILNGDRKGWKHREKIKHILENSENKRLLKQIDKSLKINKRA